MTTLIVGGVDDLVNVYEFDALNRVTRLEQTGMHVKSKTVEYVYHRDGQLENIKRWDAEQDGTGPSNFIGMSSYAYHANGMLKSLTHTNNDVIDSEVVYTWDYNERNLIERTTQKRPSVSTDDNEQTYTYDANGQLKEDSSIDYGPNGNRIYDGYLTGDNNRLLEDPNYTYEYDKDGNRTKRIVKPLFDETLSVASCESLYPHHEWIDSFEEGHDGSQCVFTSDGQKKGKAVWTVDGLVAGTYEIYATWNGDVNGALAEFSTANLQTKEVSSKSVWVFLPPLNELPGSTDSSGDPVRWEQIATQSTNDGGKLVISVTSRDAVNGQTILADAIRIIRTETTHPVTVYEWDHRGRLAGVEHKSADESQTLAAIDYYYDVLDRRVGKFVDDDGDDTIDRREYYTYDGQQVAVADALIAEDNEHHRYRYLWAPAVDQLLALEQRIEAPRRHANG